MKFFVWIILIGGTLQFSSIELTAGTRAVASEEQACRILEIEARKTCLSLQKPNIRCSCESLPKHPVYYLLGLHCGDITSREVVGSSLVGWYAIDKSTGKVFEWDINENRALSPKSGVLFGYQ